MMRAKVVRDWLAGFDDDTELAIDDDGMRLVTVADPDRGPWLEVGGVPLEDEDDDGPPGAAECEAWEAAARRLLDAAEQPVGPYKSTMAIQENGPAYWVVFKGRCAFGADVLATADTEEEAAEIVATLNRGGCVCHVFQDDDGRPRKPVRVSCGGCGSEWCERCDPAPAALCHTCHGRGHSTAPLNPGGAS